MKAMSLLLLLATGSFLNTSLYAQCCPYVTSVATDPENPTASDPISIIIEVSTPNQGHKLSKQFYLQNDTIFLEACYYSGYLTQPEVYTDTFSIGLMEEGNYLIHLTAIQSFNADVCDNNDQQKMTDELAVKNATGIIEPGQHLIAIYPNPFKDQITIKGQTIESVSIFNINAQQVFFEGGKKVHELSLDLQFLLPGIYFLSVKDTNGKWYGRMITRSF